MTSPSRDEELKEIIENALEKDESLKIALDIFQMGQTEYLNALSSMNTVRFVSSDNTNEGSIEDALLDRD